jgi:anion-transporting  ArsA/GET3 family ATPase
VDSLQIRKQAGKKKGALLSTAVEDRRMSLNDVLATHRVVVCVGCGGVGKTTTAASLAVHGALNGKRVLCLTIDPAKRLANSLGLARMTTEEQIVPRELFEQHGLTLKGSLSAMMLDTKRTFDELVAKYASSPEAAQRILANRVYQYLSSSLAGTQEYMAMEKLHAVRGDRRYDLIVLDTPPTSNALDFLDAPERLAGLVDSPAMRWFIEAFQGAGKFSFNLIGKGAAFLLRGLSRFTGTGFLEVVAQFVTDFNDLFGGFRERARQVAEALRSPEVAFVIVTSPNPLAMEEAIFFARRLSEAGMRRDAIVINGMRPLFAEPSANDRELAKLVAAHLPSMDAERAVGRMRRALDDARIRAIADRLEADRLRQRAGSDELYVEVPAFEQDVHELSALAEVASYLTGAQTMPTVVT